MKKFWKRILAIVLILAMTAGDSAVSYAVEETDVYEESESSSEELSDGGATDEEDAEADDSEDAGTEDDSSADGGSTEADASSSEEGTTIGSSAAEEDSADAAESTADENTESDSADEVYTAYEETESGNSWVSDETLETNAVSAISEEEETAEWSGSFGAQLDDGTTVGEVALQLYEAMVNGYTDTTNYTTGECSFTLSNPFTFEASITESEAEDGTVTRSITTDDNYNAACDDMSEAYSRAFNAFWLDYPEVFWFSSMKIGYKISASTDSGSSTGYTGKIAEITLTASEYYSGAMSQVEDYWEAVYSILVELGLKEETVDGTGETSYTSTGCSDYTAVKLIHDYLCDTITYNTTAANHMDDTSYDYAHTSSAAFLGYGDVGKSVVCDGYSKAFKVLCDAMGLDCVLVTGYGVTSADYDMGAHAWNYVQMDGKWYLVDVTWDDPDSEDSEIAYTYFLAGSGSAGYINTFTVSMDHLPEMTFSGMGSFSFIYPTLEEEAYTVTEQDDEEAPVRLYGLVSDENEGTTTATVLGYFDSLREAMDYAEECTGTYTDFRLELYDNVYVYDGILELPEGAEFCELDLNGFQMTVFLDTTIQMDVYDSSADRSGSVVVEKDLSLTLKAGDEENTTVYDIPDLSFDTSSTSGGLTISDSNVSLSVDRMTISGTLTAAGGSTLSIRGKAEIPDLSIVTGSTDADGVYEPFYINLDTVYLSTNTENPCLQGELSITGMLTKASALSYAVSLGKREMTVIACTWEYYEDADPTYVSFEDGETALSVSQTDANIPVAYFCLTENDEQCLYRNTSTITVYDAVVRVEYGDAFANFGSFDLAVSGLAAAFGSEEGSYTFVFVHDSAMTKNITLPTYVTELILTADSEEDEDGNVLYSYAEFDLNGYTLSSSKATVTLHEGLRLVSSASTNGTLSLTATPSSGSYSFRIVTFADGESLNTAASDDAGTESTDTTASENDEEDSTLLIDGVNIMASSGSVLLEETESTAATDETADSDETQEDTRSYTLNSVITVKQLYVNSGDWSVDTVSGSIENYGTLRVETAKTISTLDNKSGAVFVCGTFVQASSGTTYLEADSVFVVKESATIYNTVLGGQDGETDGDAHFYQYEGASVSFLTKVSQTNTEVYLSCGIVAVDEEGEPVLDNDGTYTVAGASPRTTLFTTKISSFPVAYCKAEQPETVTTSEDYSSYTVVYQNGQKICVGGEWIAVYAQGTNGTETLLAAFTRWTDAQSYLNTLANTSMTYIIELTDDVIIEESLTLPTKVGELIFRGVGDSDEDRVVFSFVGNLSLTVDTSFENIELQPTKYSSSSGEYEAYASVITLNGKDLTLTNVLAADGYIDYIKGTTASTLTVEDSELYTSRYLNTIGTVNVSDSELTIGTGLSSTGSAIAAVTHMTLKGSVISAQGSVAVTNTLTLEGSENTEDFEALGYSMLDTNGKMSLVNVVSGSAGNVLGYGGNSSSNILTITGTVSTDAEDLCGDVTVQVTGFAADEDSDLPETSVIGAALRVIVHALEDDEDTGYAEGDALLNATKVSASWFYVGEMTESTDDEGGTMYSVSYAAYKDGTVIRCGSGTSEAAVLLTTLVAGDDDTEETYVTNGAFATLQEAFSEIDRLADTSTKYKITIQDDTAEVVTKTSTNLTFPSKTAGLVITGATETDSAAAATSDETDNSETSSDNTNKTIYFNSSITLKSNVTLENITLSPKSSGTITLSAWSLVLDSCDIEEDKKITSISGSGVSGASSLTLSGSDLTVSGTVSGVGNVYLYGTMLSVQSTVNIGNLYAETVDGTASVLIGYATVTRKNNVITAVSTSMTINGDVYAAEDDSLTIGLQEKLNGEYVELDFGDSDAVDASLLASGVKIAKVLNVSTKQISVLNADDTEGTGFYLVKSSGYLSCTTIEPGVLLTYTDEDHADGWDADMETYCLTIAQASTEINNLKTKRDYTMELQTAITDSTYSSPAALTMPTAAYVSSLLIDGTTTTVYFTGSISLTTNTTLQNIDLVQMVKSGSTYVTTADKYTDYPPVMTLSVGAYALDIEGDVIFHTPLALTGGNKGTLTLGKGARLFTETNGYTTGSAGDEVTTDASLICGTVKSFAQITIQSSQTLVIREYTTNQKTWTAPALSATTLNNQGTILLYSNEVDSYAASVSVTNAVFQNGTLDVEGSVALTNLTLLGESSITVDKTFNITGTLTCTTDEAYLYTRRQAVNKAPYLNVSGTVVLQDESTDRIHVGVYPALTETINDTAVTLENAPSATGQLLTAKNADADKFLPWEENVGCSEEYSSDSMDGYILKKSGTAIYVYQSDEIMVALCEGVWSDSSLEDVEEKGKVLDYYPSLSDAVTAINTLKDSSATYTLMLLQDVGSSSSPLFVTLPTYAAEAIITSEGSSTGSAKAIYYTNTLTLKCATVFDDVVFAPLTAKKAGTTLGFSTGVYDLTLRNVSVADGSNLGAITGNAKQTTTLDSEGLTLTSNVQNSKELVVSQDAEIQGVLKSTVLRLESGVTLTAGGTVTVTTLILQGDAELSTSSTVTITNIENNDESENSDAGANRITYGRTAKNVTYLTISGTVSGSNAYPLELNMSCDLTAEDLILSMSGVKTSLTDAKKLANITKAPTSAFTFLLDEETLEELAEAYNTEKEEGNSEEETVTASDTTDDAEMEEDSSTKSYQLVKASKAFYLIDEEMPDTVTLVYTEDSDEADSVEVSTVCLDWNQAVNEITVLADSSMDYTVELDGDVLDTNITDSNAYSALTMPGSNKAASVTVCPVAADTSDEDTTGTETDVTDDGESRTVLQFYGNITAYGNLTLESVQLYSTRSYSDNTTTADFKVTVTKTNAGASLTLNNVSTYADDTWENGYEETTGFISQITGTNKTTDVMLIDCTLRLKTGISSIGNLALEDTALTSCGAATVYDLTLTGESSWDALGKTSIANVYNSGMTGGYLASKQTSAGLSQMTITGTVSDPLLFRLATADCMTNKVEYLDSYKNVMLVTALKADADMFVAYPYGKWSADDSESDTEADASEGTADEGTENVTYSVVVVGNDEISAANWIAYKNTSGYVYNSDKDGMAVSITKTSVGTTSSVSYAASFYEAVTIINNAADATAAYTIEFLSTGEVGTAKEGAYGALTLPTKAASVTIIGASEDASEDTSSTDGTDEDSTTGSDSDSYTVLCYTGTLTPRCNVCFKNIQLTEGTYNSKTGFTPSYSVTPTLGSYTYTLSFAEGTATLTDEFETDEEIQAADLVFSYVSGSKGTLSVEGLDVYVKKQVSVGTLALDEDSSGNASSLYAVSYVTATNLQLNDAALSADSYITVTNLNVQGTESSITTYNAMKLTTLSAVEEEEESGEESETPVVRLYTGFTASAKSTTQLTISGTVSGVAVEIVPYLYDSTDKSYHAMTEDEAAALNIADGETPTSYDKIAVLTKASTENFSVLMVDSTAANSEKLTFTEAAYKVSAEDEDGEETMIAYSLYKYDGGLYLTDQEMAVRLLGYEDSEMSEAVYQADFLDWDQAVKEIDRIADMSAYYEMLLMTDVGSASSPKATLSMPTKAAAVCIAPYVEESTDSEDTSENGAESEEQTTGEEEDDCCDTATAESSVNYYFFFTGTTLTLRCDTTFESVGLIALKKTTVSGVTSYASTTFNIAGSSWDLVMNAVPGSATSEDGTTYESLVGTVSGSAKGSFTFYQGDGDSPLTAVATKLTNFGTVSFYNELSSLNALEISGSFSGVTNLNLYGGVELDVSGGALTATNLTMLKGEYVSGGSLSAKNITCTGTVTLESATISAGTDTAGDGIVKLGTVVCRDYDNEIFAKQNSSGVSQLTITGQVSYGEEEADDSTDTEETESSSEDDDTDDSTETAGEAAIKVGLYYNNSASQFAQLYDGMTLLTASKAYASWFEPYYTSYTTTSSEDGEETSTTTVENAGMGASTSGYGLVKSGSLIKYMSTSGIEVRLHYLETVDDVASEIGNTLFATFEEAVTEINILSRYQSGTKAYENYEIELLTDVEIGNASNNGSYSTLTLPTKAGSVRIYSDGEQYTIYYAGTLTLRCNTEFDNVALSPMKAVNKVGVATAAAWSLGAYTLTLDDVGTTDADGNTLVSSVTGSTNSELQLQGDTGLSVSGKVSVYQIRFAEEDAEDDSSLTVLSGGTDCAEPVLGVDGTLTVTLIYLDGDVMPVIEKPESSTFTLNGASLDVDGDGEKENASVIITGEDDDITLTVALQTEAITAGMQVLSCKYLDPGHYTVKDELGFTYNTYQSGNYLMVGSLVADMTLEGFYVIDADGTQYEVTYALTSTKADYTGSAITPGLMLQWNDGKNTLDAAYYTVTYEDNTEPGTAKITVTPASDSESTDGDGSSADNTGSDDITCEGEGTITFTIRKKSLVSSDLEIVFTGYLKKGTVDDTEVWIPEVKVTDYGRMSDDGSAVSAASEEDSTDSAAGSAGYTLTAGVDYTLTYRIESDGSVSAVLSEYSDGCYRGKVVKNFAELSGVTDSVTLTDCLAASAKTGETSEGAIDCQTETSLLIELVVSGDLSDQTNLYIVEMDNQGSEILDFIGSATAEYSSDSGTTTLTATLYWDVESEDEDEDVIIDAFNSTMMDRYALVAVLDDGYQIISENPLLVQNPWVTAVTTNRYYSYNIYNSDGERDYSSKKGLQHSDDNNVPGYFEDLGVQATIINIKLNELIKTSTNLKNHPDWANSYIPYEYKGTTYYFLDIVSIQRTIYNLNGFGDNNIYGLNGGIFVSVDLLLAWDSELTYLIHPSARVKGYSYYALNMQEEKARETFEALFCYLGYKLGGSSFEGQKGWKYRVMNWTLGNEVNCCKAWNYSGNLSTSACAANYAEAFQLLYQAITRTNSNARFFISLDHSWTASTEGHSGKSYLNSFAAYMAETAPQMSWNVNYHPYSQPLTTVNFMGDSTNTTSSANTPYISMKNLSVLTNYLETLEETYDMENTCKNAQERTEDSGYIRVILGEQGYTGRYGYTSEMSAQASALSKMHDIAMDNERVDTYMNRAYYDDASEAASGLYLGLMNASEKKKTAYTTFQNLD
ncbi:MAG: DUF5722 domain-containing protein [Lachnospiraceae bacterium]|nr:DUF5722 domain-containing protein [Lachnospiraceae bacterium]